MSNSVTMGWCVISSSVCYRIWLWIYFRFCNSFV